ncbi:hypothetical protein STIUS_v1c04480 [Spiroplasma sp. TIUS-1]|uniref:YceD family protein n=1 Tax=Spiroplasma sp. TIUS-1 TaxID=216963 RepID=UPI0013976781|nr:DUF177 domain-containing protein [Spiroplasma sp. TIUS-1]QHX36002.1 hypothetical protein STIUS_v1c04480 [Spiroplasma sp. TIUS-1]
MKFDIKSLEKKVDIKINDDFDLKEMPVGNSLVSKLKNLHLDVNVHYEDTMRMVIVTGSGTVSAKFNDARDGKEFEDEIEFEWNDDYVFYEPNSNAESNIIMDDEFDIIKNALDQFFLNIPLNFSKNYDNINLIGENFALISEDEYQSLLENRVDPRWEQLEEIKKKLK